MEEFNEKICSSHCGNKVYLEDRTYTGPVQICFWCLTPEKPCSNGCGNKVYHYDSSYRGPVPICFTCEKKQ